VSKAELEALVTDLAARVTALEDPHFVVLDYSADDINPHHAGMPAHALLSLRNPPVRKG
jgi:hypothetical protein